MCFTEVLLETDTGLWLGSARRPKSGVPGKNIFQKKNQNLIRMQEVVWEVDGEGRSHR